MKTRRVFISADHGLSIVYFLQSDVVPTLLERGVEVVLLTDDALRGKIHERFKMPGLSIEGLKLSEAKTFQNRSRDAQWWLAFLRRVGGPFGCSGVRLGCEWGSSGSKSASPTGYTMSCSIVTVRTLSSRVRRDGGSTATCSGRPVGGTCRRLRLSSDGTIPAAIPFRAPRSQT